MGKAIGNIVPCSELYQRSWDKVFTQEYACSIPKSAFIFVFRCQWKNDYQIDFRIVSVKLVMSTAYNEEMKGMALNGEGEIIGGELHLWKGRSSITLNSLAESEYLVQNLFYFGHCYSIKGGADNFHSFIHDVRLTHDVVNNSDFDNQTLLMILYQQMRTLYNASLGIEIMRPYRNDLPAFMFDPDQLNFLQPCLLLDGFSPFHFTFRNNGAELSFQDDS